MVNEVVFVVYKICPSITLYKRFGFNLLACQVFFKVVRKMFRHPLMFLFALLSPLMMLCLSFFFFCPI